MGIGKTAPVVCLLLIALGSRVGVMAHGKRLEERSYGSFPLNATATTNTSTVTAATTALVYTQSDFIVTVIDVARVRQSAGYLFTVRYVPHAQNVRVAYVLAAVKSQQETYSHLYELQAVAEQGGVRSVSFGWSFADYDGTDNNIVYFMTDTERVGIKVFMDPGTSGNLKTALHPWPLTVSPADQLVYRSGQDTPLLDIQYTNSTSMNLDIVMVNLRTGDAEFGEMVDHSSYFLSTIRNKYGSGREKQVQGKLKTSRYRISGFVTVAATEYIWSNSSAVKAVKVEKRLVLRPEKQAGPLPDGYLGFVRVPGGSYTRDRKQIYPCNITDKAPCRELVYVLSESSVQLNCTEVLSNGNHQRLAVTPPSDLEFNPAVQSFLFSVQPSSPGQESSNVQCVAVNETGYQVVKEIQVLYYTQAQIVVARSSVENTSLVTVSCVAAGRPLPTAVSVEVGVKQQQDEWLTTTHYRIAQADLLPSPDGTYVTGTVRFPQVYTKPLVSVACSASNGYHYYTVERNKYAGFFSSAYAKIFGH